MRHLERRENGTEIFKSRKRSMLSIKGPPPTSDIDFVRQLNKVEHGRTKSNKVEQWSNKLIEQSRYTCGGDLTKMSMKMHIFVYLVNRPHLHYPKKINQ